LRSRYKCFKPYTGNINEPSHELADTGLYFKFYNPTTDIKLIRFFLEENGFLEHQIQYSRYAASN
jgi:hypothetical protein